MTTVFLEAFIAVSLAQENPDERGRMVTPQACCVSCRTACWQGWDRHEMRSFKTSPATFPT
ncbi:unnamed protein product [Ciceribacter sp. T2.26MG-112.2]|nr:unnamed protein product [Ciceribacter naphthalenivorans]